jgi:hypothetical protein
MAREATKSKNTHRKEAIPGTRGMGSNPYVSPKMHSCPACSFLESHCCAQADINLQAAWERRAFQKRVKANLRQRRCAESAWITGVSKFNSRVELA